MRPVIFAFIVLILSSLWVSYLKSVKLDFYCIKFNELVRKTELTSSMLDQILPSVLKSDLLCK